MDESLPYAVGFSLFPGIGPARYTLLTRYFGTPKAAWTAPLQQLVETGLSDSLCSAFDRFRRTTDIPGYMTRARDQHIAIIAQSDGRYPALLREIPDAPIVLYVRGKRGTKPLDLGRTIGIVGTRKLSRYGEQVTHDLSSDLAAVGVTIVSGLAFGADTVAHKSALDSGGATIAVLGCGVDIPAPSSNAWLYQEIIGSGRGAVVSEMPLGMRPNRRLFPVRNRIISGLSLGVIVTEGLEDSGSLITASYAASQGREVFAVPGPVTSPLSRASAILIRNGATLVERASDVLTELGLPGIKHTETVRPKLSGAQEQVRVQLTGGPKHIDAIVRGSGLTVSEVTAILTVLEMDGTVRNDGDNTFGLT